MHFFGDVHFEWRTHWEEALRETRPVQKELVIMRCGFIMPHQSLSANRRLFPLRLWKSKQFTQTPRKSLQYTIQKHNIFFLPNNKETSCRDFFSLSIFFYPRLLAVGVVPMTVMSVLKSACNKRLQDPA